MERRGGDLRKWAATVLLGGVCWGGFEKGWVRVTGGGLMRIFIGWWEMERIHYFGMIIG